MFQPQSIAPPLESRASDVAAPAATALTPERPATGTGVLLQGLLPQVSGPVLLPSPSSPSKFRPQAMSVPFESRARLWHAPQATATTPESPATGTGVLLHELLPQVSGPVLLPLPSWPNSFSPHALTVPSARRARLCSAPAEIAVTPLSPLTATG